jgi:sensor domain CHASE-containing protein
MSFTVELREHKGRKMTDLGMVEVSNNQDIVFIINDDGTEVYAGYVGHAKKAHISLILRDLVDEQLEEIKRQVDVIRESRDLPATTAITKLRSIDQNQYKVEIEDDKPTEDDLL